MRARPRSTRPRLGHPRVGRPACAEAGHTTPGDAHPSLLGGRISNMATPVLRDKSHTAVLIMDYQNDIVTGMVAHHPALLDRAAAVLSGARLAGLPVIYVIVGFRPGYPEISDRNRLFRSLKEAGPRGEGTPGPGTPPRGVSPPDG